MKKVVDDSDPVESAIAAGTMALEAEKSGRLVEAKDRYTEAVGLFLRACQGTKDSKRAGLLKAQALDFIERAEQLAVRLKDEADPLLSEARKLVLEAGAAEAAGDYLGAKQLHAKAIERYLELLRLEASGAKGAKNAGPKGDSLRREAEGAFARAERVQAVLLGRERDEARLPLDRSQQLEAAALEASRRGDIE